MNDSADFSDEIVVDEPAFELDGTSPTDPSRQAQPPATRTGDAHQLAVREQKHRGWVAGALLGLVTAASIAIFIGAFCATPDQWERVERAAEIVLVPLMTLLGTAIGWFFGQRSR